MFVIQFIQFMKKEGEHSNSLRIYICFRQRSIQKNYTSISVKAYNKSMLDRLRTHISP